MVKETDRSEIDRKLECLFPGGILREEPMSRHTTFRIGGPAEWYLCPPVDLLPQVLALVTETGVPLTVIGNGSNLLVADAGIRGVVLEIGKELELVEIISADDCRKEKAYCEEACENAAEHEPGAERDEEADPVRMRIGAGTLLSKAARVALDAGLSGMEFAAGIPGSLGGAVVMNAGAYGGQMKDILVEVTVLTPEGKRLVFSRQGEKTCRTPETKAQTAQTAGTKECSRMTEANESRLQSPDIRKDDGECGTSDSEYHDIEELDLSYRHSVIPERRYIVTEAVVELTPAPKDEIQAQMADLRQRRIDKQPLEFPSAGSTFKRPEGYFAGKLIEDAGLKGYTVGGAQVSQKHSGFVINIGNATAADVRQLIADVQERVMQQFGVLLEPEIRMLGDFEESIR